ncbi:MAG TPA: hypothetical protein VFK03_02340 [Candidatus Saccharimonadales bacterium]|nr:hypothetical protein [Candidatus Saccharimonadales bacterium]
MDPYTNHTERIYAVIHHADSLFLPDGQLPNCASEAGSSAERSIASHVLREHRLAVSNQLYLGRNENSHGFLMRLSSGANIPVIGDENWLQIGTILERLANREDEATAIFARLALQAFPASRHLDSIA